MAWVGGVPLTSANCQRSMVSRPPLSYRTRFVDTVVFALFMRRRRRRRPGMEWFGLWKEQGLGGDGALFWIGVAISS